MSGCSVDQHVDVWQRERIFWARLVEVGEIDSNTPLAILFLTTTTFASQSGYWTLRIDPMSISFWISSLITRFLLGANFLLFCLTGG